MQLLTQFLYAVSNCGWNSSGMPTYLVLIIVLTIILPCVGCAGFSKYYTPVLIETKLRVLDLPKKEILLLVVSALLIALKLVAAACHRKVLEFPVDPWADVPLNQDPDNNGNKSKSAFNGGKRPWRAQDSSFPPISFSSN